MKICLRSSIRTGCVDGDTVVNQLMYADDRVLLGPSSAGLQQLPNVCSRYEELHNMKYNDAKSVILVSRTNESKGWFPLTCC